MGDEPGTSNGASRKRDRKKSVELPSRTVSDERDYVDDKPKRLRARRNWMVFAEKLRNAVRQTSDIQFRTILFDVKDGKVETDGFCLNFITPSTKTSFDKLIDGFDNTGNVKIWPGSEALAWVVLKSLGDAKKWQNVLEVGAGFLGLAGFAASHRSSSCQVYITDGNPDSISNLKTICEMNDSQNIRVEQVLWGETQLAVKVDVVLAADCIFFDKLHENLMKCFDMHLENEGIVYLASPRRKGSLDRFVSFVKENWTQFVIRFEDAINQELDIEIRKKLIFSKEQEDEDLPIILSIRRKRDI